VVFRGFVVRVERVVKSPVVDEDELSVTVLEQERVRRADRTVVACDLLYLVAEVGVVPNGAVLGVLPHLL